MNKQYPLVDVTMDTNFEIYTMDDLRNAMTSAIALGAAIDNTIPLRLLELGQLIWDQFPMMFPDFAICAVDEPFAPSICRAVWEDLRNTPGAYDICRFAWDLGRDAGFRWDDGIDWPAVYQHWLEADRISRKINRPRAGRLGTTILT